ncbi:LLM class flavin-dependent oxidoreductase [Natrononativus amylolyticus]|uniref:LLM class flavin-dependent oxidoreductase n=1 Tax=Natrononativus amylolyticus TaxID=2963434 RepID=UPI0020CD19EF|nr:LLM class flavin-dependent oxidoreductase [Natrononativus amylolyticus]
MKFGVFLNQYYTPESEFELAHLFEQADLMEELGFDGAALGERHVHEEGFVEPVTTLAALAARTETLDLATMAMLPVLYNPLTLAEQIATVDRLSGGRMHFGAAIGYREREIEPFGIDMEERSKAFIESLHVLKRLWADESVSHDGDRWSFEDVFVSPRPAGSMPVWIGGHADIAIKRAAYRGDAWIASASSTTDDLAHQIGVYEDSLEEFEMDRADNDVVLMRDCFVADSLEDARETIEPYLLQMYEWYARWGQTYMDEHEVEVDYDELEEKFVLGSPEDCLEKLRTYEDLGVDQVYLRVQFPGQPQDVTLECLERFGEEVMPAFASGDR